MSTPAASQTITSPLAGTVVFVGAEGARIEAGAPVAIIDSMKMEHEVGAPCDGIVMAALVGVGDAVGEGAELVRFAHAAMPRAASASGARPASPAGERADLAEVLERRRRGLDSSRPEALARRRARHRRSARENLADLVDAGSFIEFGPVVVAAQRARRDLAELIERTPADGLVGGIATVNAGRTRAADHRCVVASYDYMVLAGTQGQHNHMKKDRLFELARRMSLPVVLFTEGGGGRPGDTDFPGVSWLDCAAFALFGELAGKVPTIGVNAGYCFAGNAALLGSCDVIVATADSNIGMAGPAMIEGGGLGSFSPQQIGPSQVQTANGVIDVLVADEAEAIAAARMLIGYVQGDLAQRDCHDQRALRDLVPENRLRVYDMNTVIDTLVDRGSRLDLRRSWTPGMITCFARIEGRALGLIANNPQHLSGAIDHGAATKAGDFMQLCDRWKIPLLFLCDTPGFMVGPDSDAQGLVRSAGTLFRLGANLGVPFATVVIRKAYGLGAQAMAGGGLKEPLFAVSWPTGEFGPMGLEGAVRLGYARELAAKPEGGARDALFDELVGRMYERGHALNVASHFEIDDVIDPAETRRWITTILLK